MTSTQDKRSVIPLFEGEHDDLQVVRLDGDRFVLTVQQAIDACSLASHAARFQPQFADLMDTLYAWVEQRKPRISAAYISVGNAGIMLLVVQRDVPADFDLEDELVQLDLDVAQEDMAELISFNTLLVPKVSDQVLQSFLSSGKIMGHQVNAEQE